MKWVKAKTPTNVTNVTPFGAGVSNRLAVECGGFIYLFIGVNDRISVFKCTSFSPLCDCTPLDSLNTVTRTHW